MLSYLRMEILRTLRAPAFLAYTIGFPAGFYLLFTTVFGHGDRAAAGYAMVSMALYGAILAALPGFGARIAMERTRGWTRQLALSPMRASQYLVIQLVAVSLLTVPVIVAILLLGGVVNGVDLTVVRWFALLGVVWAGSLPFVGLGVLIGYTFRYELAQGACMVAVFLLSIAGGLWVPATVFPHWLAGVAHALPTFRAGQLGWAVIGADHVTATGLAVLGGWTVLIAVLAGWRFRRAS